jgi:predicted acetyltransferase
MSLARVPLADQEELAAEDQDQRAGFALVTTHHYLPGSGWSVAELWVDPRRRRAGVGRRTVAELLALHPGRWEVAILPGNRAALASWTVVLAGAARLERFATGTVAGWDGELLVAAR